MPKLGTGFQKYEQKRTINELFLNLGEILDQDMFRGIEFIIELLREGWKHGRLSLETTQAQHRDVVIITLLLIIKQLQQDIGILL